MTHKYDLNELTPSRTVEELNRYIIGQEEAKKAVAVALRNRYRRALLTDEMREEVTPKNIILMGPTGVGKTEITRRIAKLVNAPLVKVEATKFTEVGYVGRDVESMIRDLVSTSVRKAEQDLMEAVRPQAEAAADDIIADTLAGLRRKKKESGSVALGSILPDPQIAALTATGGLVLVGIAFRLLRIREIPVGDMLPALVVAPLLTQLVISLG